MEVTELAKETMTMGTAKQVSTAISNPAALGINNLMNVSHFVTAASDLGLHNTSSITAFMNVSASIGGLASGITTLETANQCMSSGIMNGILAPNIACADKALSLLNNAKALGTTATNVKEKVAAIQAQAQKFGLKPQKPADKKKEEPTASEGLAITCHKLRFVPFDLTDILGVCMEQNINEHGTLYIKGVLKAPAATGKEQASEPEDQAIQKAAVGTAVALYSIDEKGEVEMLFQGLIVNIKQTQTTDLKYIEVEAASPSYNLDVKKNSRSFQRMSATYDDIINIVNAGQGQIKNNQPSKQVGKFIIQYKETDWTFYKRIASHYNTGIVPVVTSDTIQIHFGVPKGQKAKTITASSYSIKKKMGEFRTTKANDMTHSQATVSDIDFICYEVESFERLNIGDCINFLSHTLYIQSISTKLEQGVLTYHYTLVSEKGLYQKDLFNPDLAGISLMGQVKVITKDQIKAHIVEIDAEWDSSADWYFPYSTVFSSPGGSGWYAMPEPGDTIRIYFPTHKDEDAIAASSVNRDQSAQSQKQTEEGAASGGGSDAPRTDPDKKSFSNKYGKEVLFTPDGIYITNQAGQIFINLTDAKGISIVSTQDISLKSKQNIILNAEQDIIMNAKEKLSMTCKGASITSDQSGLIEIKGQEVKAN